MRGLNRVFGQDGDNNVMIIVSVSGPDADGVFRYEAECSGVPDMRGSLVIEWNDLGHMPFLHIKCDNWEGLSNLYQDVAWPVASGWSINIQGPGDIR